jgi:hypothetical protein
MTQTELQRHLASVTPAADEWTLQPQRVDQGGRVVGHLLVAEGATRIGGTTMTAVVEGDDPVRLSEERHNPGPAPTREQPGVGQHDWISPSLLLDKETDAIDLDLLS